MHSALLVFSHCFQSGKRSDQQLGMTSHAGSAFQSRLFHVIDRISGTRFLIDTGAEVNVLPPTHSEKRHCSPLRLQAVNKTSITTYGEKSLTLDLGLRRIYRWIFTVADIPFPILGADFLAFHDLTVSVDSCNKLSHAQVVLNTSLPLYHKTCTLDPMFMYAMILSANFCSPHAMDHIKSGADQTITLCLRLKEKSK